ncbi:MAG TPA: hypothetical protein DCY10_00440, partial [Clostridiales bacterium]|nr:hypothetical protein [Clostridiales bacterium]
SGGFVCDRLFPAHILSERAFQKSTIVQTAQIILTSCRFNTIMDEKHAVFWSHAFIKSIPLIKKQFRRYIWEKPG